MIASGLGDLLPVSAFPVDGTWPVGTSRYEKRNLALEIPVWDEQLCIQCNKCVFACPHAAIRAKHYDAALVQSAPAGFKSTAFRSREHGDDLYTLQVAPESISWERWEALQKEFGARSQLDILADIGLGKRLSFVVAQALTRPAGKAESAAGAGMTQPAALTLRGVEGVAIQYGKCCRPIPGDKVIGQFRKGQGLIVHLRDCITLKKQRGDADQFVDVDWAPDVEGVFDAGIRLLVADRRGLLADLATAIADAQGNIDNVSMERPDGAGLIAMFFSIQVRDRRHLAQIMRQLKRVDAVRRVQRTRT